MINLTDKERLELLGAVFMDELKVIREYLSDIPIIKQDLRELTARFEHLEQVVTEHTYDIRQLKQQTLSG